MLLAHSRKLQGLILQLSNKIRNSSADVQCWMDLWSGSKFEFAVIKLVNGEEFNV